MKRIVKKYIFVLLLLIHGSFVAFGQGDAMSRGDQYFQSFDFDNAIKEYLKVTDKKATPSQEVCKKLGDSYFMLNDYLKAYKWYNQYYSLVSNDMDEITFLRLIESAKANRDYDKANELLFSYYNSNKQKMKVLAAQKKHVDSLVSSQSDTLWKIMNLTINTAYSDFGAAYYDSKVVFSSSRPTEKLNESNYVWNEQPYLNLYEAEKNADGQLAHGKVFLNNINTPYHDAMVTFSPDGKTIYFTRNQLKKRSKLNSNDEGVSTMTIFKGTIDNGELKDVQELSFINPEYSYGHPTLSKDGKFLYFVSDMPGGMGQTDLYMAEVFADGIINTPVNLGPEINTIGREMFPFISGDTLYFSSDGFYGYGGLDIYQSVTTKKGQFSLPQNIGSPVNSNMDDFAYIIDTEKQTGYFSSNRLNGKGDDDLYFFKKSKAVVVQYFKGNVADDQSKKPIEGVEVSITDAFGNEVAKLATDSLGNYLFELPGNQLYDVTYTKPEYSSDTTSFETTLVPNLVINGKPVYLTYFKRLVADAGDGKEKIKVNPIYFDYNKYDITPKAIEELDKVVYAMKKFPTVKIKIESHTDSRGKDAYNLVLSDNRAKSTRDYLISQGIDSERIESAIGYGETRLINNCGNGVKCSEEMHAVNRRSDFIIISK